MIPGSAGLDVTEGFASVPPRWLLQEPNNRIRHRPPAASSTMSLLPERPRYSLFSSRGPASGRTPYDRHSRLRSPTSRPKPYDKPVQPPPPVNPEARWNHDLFEDDSNLYGPKVKYHVQSPDLISFGSIRPSPSMRPFGSVSTSPTDSATSLPRPSARTASNSIVSHPIKSVASRPPPVKPQTNRINSHSGISLLSRIQSNDTQKPFAVNDSSSNLSHSNSNLLNPMRLQQNNLIENPSSGLGRPDHPITLSQSIKLQSQNSKNQQEFDVAMVKYLNGPVILEVANLADGTSAEDVKTAFADFGEIQECTTEEGARQGNQPTLKAKMIFTNKEEAEKAVEALNGALADGLTLAVKIVGRPTKKPDRADFMTTTSGGEAKMKLATIDTKIKPQNQEDVTMEDSEPAATPTVPTGRLRSEVVAQCDPRASIQVEPKPIPIYRPEKSKPIIRNMLSRVQAFPGSHQTGAVNHHSQYRNGFGTSRLHSVKHTQSIQSPKSLLARIKPN